MEQIIENGTYIETYKSNSIPPVRVPQQIGEYAKYAEKLGFSSVAKLVESKVKHEIAKSLYHPLSTSEFETLHNKFPRDYVVTKTELSPCREYHFDLIPLGVLRELEIARESNLFRDIFILTPERARDVDPLLIGSINNDMFLIARWGSALEPLEKLLKRPLIPKLNAGNILGIMTGILFLSLVIAMMICIIAQNQT